MGSSFITNHLATLGVDLSVKRIEVVDGNTLELQIWDIAGHEGFERLRSRYFQGAHIAFMVFDLTLRSSFEAIEEWLDQLWQILPSRDLPYVRYYRTSAKTGENIAKCFADVARELI